MSDQTTQPECHRSGPDRCDHGAYVALCDSYEDAVEQKIEMVIHWFPDPYLKPWSGDDFKINLADDIIRSLEEQLICPACYQYYHHGDCQRCGAPNVGAVGSHQSVEAPSDADYSSVGIPSGSVLCEDCLEEVVETLRQDGLTPFRAGNEQGSSA